MRLPLHMLRKREELFLARVAAREFWVRTTLGGPLPAMGPWTSYPIVELPDWREAIGLQAHLILMGRKLPGARCSNLENCDPSPCADDASPGPVLVYVVVLPLARPRSTARTS